MQNTYNEIGDTSVIFLHAREYLSYSLAMEKCWSNARILHCATMEKSVIFKPFNYVVWFIIAIASFSTELGVVVHETCCQQASTAACLNALCVASSLAASLWCLAVWPPSPAMLVLRTRHVTHHRHCWLLFVIIHDSCFASCDLFFAILAAHCCHIVPFLLLIIMTLVTRCTLCYWSTINQQDSVRFTQD